MGQNTAASKALQSYELRERASERERLYITGHYRKHDGNTEAARTTYELWPARIRDDVLPPILRSYTRVSGIWTKVWSPLATREEARRYQLRRPLPRLCAAKSGWDEAKAIAQKPKLATRCALSLQRHLRIAFLQHDTEGWRASRVFGRKSGYEDSSLAIQSDTAGYLGNSPKARELTRRSVDSAVHADAKERAGFNLAVSAVRKNMSVTQ